MRGPRLRDTMPQQTSREQGHATTHESPQVYIEIYTLLSAYLLDMYLRLLLRYIEHSSGLLSVGVSSAQQRNSKGCINLYYVMCWQDSTCQILLATLANRSSSVSAGKAADKHLNDFDAPYIDWKPDWRFPEVSSSSSWSGDSVDRDTGCHAT